MTIKLKWTCKVRPCVFRKARKDEAQDVRHCARGCGATRAFRKRKSKEQP